MKRDKELKLFIYILLLIDERLRDNDNRLYYMYYKLHYNSKKGYYGIKNFIAYVSGYIKIEKGEVYLLGEGLKNYSSTDINIFLRISMGDKIDKLRNILIEGIEDNVIDIPFNYDLMNSISSYDSVSRYRRKLQEQYIYLRGDNYEKRHNFAKEVKEEIHNY